MNMTNSIKKHYEISGCGVLSIDGDKIIVSVEDGEDISLARVISELDGCSVRFNFLYNWECNDNWDSDDEVDEITNIV